MFISVKSPPEELQKLYDRMEELNELQQDVETFLSKKVERLTEQLHEVSHELAQMELNYEEVLRELLKHQPDFKHKFPFTEYKHESRLVNML